VTALKLIILGNGSAGKTSFTNAVKEEGAFAPVYRQTIGIDFHETRVTLRGKEVVLQLHDIGGQSISSKLMPAYVASAKIVMLLYDVTDTQSFHDLEDWFALLSRKPADADAAGSSFVSGAAAQPLAPSSLKSDGDDDPSGAPQPPTDSTSVVSTSTAAAASTSPSSVVFLLGNKVDLMHLRKVTEDQHDAFIRRNRLAGEFTGINSTCGGTAGASKCLQQATGIPTSSLRAWHPTHCTLCAGGFFVSAKTGEGIATALHSATARCLGFELTEEEVAATQKVLAVRLAPRATAGAASGVAHDPGAKTSVATGGVAVDEDGEAKRADADDIEREDREAEERKRRAMQGGAGCCSVQ